MPWKKHLSSPIWLLAVYVHRVCGGASWRKSMREWIGGPVERAFYDGPDQSNETIEEIEDNLRQRLDAAERREHEVHAKRLREIAEARAAIDDASEARRLAAWSSIGSELELLAFGQAYDLWADDRTPAELCAVATWRLTGPGCVESMRMEKPEIYAAAVEQLRVMQMEVAT